MANKITVNKWQKYYIDTYCDGKMPRDRERKNNIEMLGSFKSKITVNFPDGKKTYTITFDEDDMSKDNNAKISVRLAIRNIPFWISRGYSVYTI